MTIIQSVLQKFSRPKSQPEPRTRPQLRLEDALERFGPLMELQARRQLLEVITDRQRPNADTEQRPNADSQWQSCQSMILEINFGSGYILLDEPVPRIDHLQPGDHLTVKHHHKGELLTFRSRLLHIGTSQGNRCYALALPESVGYRQRRLYPRLTLSQQQPLTVRLQSPLRTPWFATAHNISAGGMRVALGGNALPQLQRDCLLPSCEFSFSPDFQVHCKARVRGYRFCRRPYRHTQISLEFVDLSPQQRLQLQQLINALGAEQPMAA